MATNISKELKDKLLTLAVREGYLVGDKEEGFGVAFDSVCVTRITENRVRVSFRKHGIEVSAYESSVWVNQDFIVSPMTGKINVVWGD